MVVNTSAGHLVHCTQAGGWKTACAPIHHLPSLHYYAIYGNGHFWAQAEKVKMPPRSAFSIFPYSCLAVSYIHICNMCYFHAKYFIQLVLIHSITGKGGAKNPSFFQSSLKVKATLSCGLKMVISICDEPSILTWSIYTSAFCYDI